MIFKVRGVNNEKMQDYKEKKTQLPKVDINEEMSTLSQRIDSKVYDN